MVEYAITARDSLDDILTPDSTGPVRVDTELTSALTAFGQDGATHRLLLDSVATVIPVTAPLTAPVMDVATPGIATLIGLTRIPTALHTMLEHHATDAVEHCIAYFGWYW